MKKIYVVKKKRNVRKVQIPILILGYIGLYININVFTKMGFTLGQWATSYGGVILGVIYFFILSIIIILWTIITIIWVFRIPKDYNDLKSSVIVFGIITLVLLSSTIFYANLFEDYNNYYTFIDVNESNGSRVKSKIDYLYFSSVMIFTIGYDEVSILGSGLKIIVASEMFVSYLLMCIFVPSIFTLISSRE
ncbi:ion channel [Paraclostridium bifermentans]|uniref:ion channel n=1 Tax=Paraclostridium bifermentans TaxID=1490 RepID=UPI00214A8311|nr:ion channel [Paraclostridium bifermentans]MCR1875815.1 ion channel [Paraclostridium bifermentans]